MLYIICMLTLKTHCFTTQGVTAVVSAVSFYRLVFLIPCPTSFKFRNVLLLDWLPTKASETSLLATWVEKRDSYLSNGISKKANTIASTVIWTLHVNPTFCAVKCFTVHISKLDKNSNYLYWILSEPFLSWFLSRYMK